MLVKIFDEAEKNGVELYGECFSWKPSLAQLQTDSISYMINGEISSEVLAWFSWTAIEKTERRLDVLSFKALHNFSKAKLLIQILYYCFSIWCCQFSIQKHMVFTSVSPISPKAGIYFNFLYYFWSIFMLSSY